MPFSPQVCCRFWLRLDLTSHSSILATAAEGEGSTKAGMITEDVREDIMPTADIPPLPQLSTLSRVTDVAIDDPPKRSPGTEHIEQGPPDVIVGEYSTVSHAPSSDVEVPSSPTPVIRIYPPIGMLSPLTLPSPYLSTPFFARTSFSDASPRR